MKACRWVSAFPCPGRGRLPTTFARSADGPRRWAMWRWGPSSGLFSSVGGGAESAPHRVGRLAQGWISASRLPAAQLPSAVRTIHQAARSVNRDPDDVRIVIRAAVRVRPQDEEQQFTGTVEKIRRDFA